MSGQARHPGEGRDPRTGRLRRFPWDPGLRRGDALWDAS
jgi:hypothetical protein